MKALTVHAPWGWAIAHRGKRIENRGWVPPVSLLGQRFAIHQGQRVDPDAAPWMAVQGLIEWGDVPLVHARGTIVATAVLAGWYDDRSRSAVMPLGHLIGHVTESPWFFGPVGWLLHDVIALHEPIPHKGAQGLWTVNSAALERIPAHAR